MYYSYGILQAIHCSTVFGTRKVKNFQFQIHRVFKEFSWCLHIPNNPMKTNWQLTFMCHEKTM